MLNILNLSYFNKEGKKILDRISLQFEPGNIYSILGLNGSGKTTFLKVLIGLWPQSSGMISWMEQDLRTLSRKELSHIVALVPQHTPVIFDYTVEQIVLMGTYSNRLINAESRLEKTLSLVNALPFRHRLITQLSTGERQRVFIARALINDSPILLLDEPTTGLDIKQQAEIWKLLARLRGEGKLIIMTSHDPQMVRELSDKVALLEEGRCTKFGDYADLCPHYFILK